MKYWLCEFHEQNGEAEYKHRHIYNDKQLDDIGHEGDDYDYRILNHFFMENITKDDEEGGGGASDEHDSGRAIARVV